MDSTGYYFTKSAAKTAERMIAPAVLACCGDYFGKSVTVEAGPAYFRDNRKYLNHTLIAGLVLRGENGRVLASSVGIGVPEPGSGYPRDLEFVFGFFWDDYAGAPGPAARRVLHKAIDDCLHAFKERANPDYYD